MDLDPSPSFGLLRSLGVELPEELVLAVPDQGEEDQLLTLAQHPCGKRDELTAIFSYVRANFYSESCHIIDKIKVAREVRGV